MSRKIVNAGAFYSYIAQGLGKMAGVASAFVALLAYNAMQIGLVGGFGVVTSNFMWGRFGMHVPWWLPALIGILLAAVLGVLRVDLNGKVLAFLLVAEIGVAIVYSVVEVAHPANGVVTFDTLSPLGLLDNGVGAGLATAIAGFVGFEATAVYSEETKDPRKTVPRATYLALVVIGLLYGGASWAMSVATGSDKVVDEARQAGTELMFRLVGPHLNRAWDDAGHILFATSLFAALLAFHNTVARYSFALGREHVLPSWMGRTSARSNAPVWGSVTQSVLAIAALGAYAWTDLDPVVYMFFWLTVLGGLGVLILMLATSVSVVVFFARFPEHRQDVGIWSTSIAPIAATVALGWSLGVTLQQFDVLLGLPAGDPRAVALPLSFAAAAFLGLSWAGILLIDKPEIFRSIGLGADRLIVVVHTEKEGVQS